MINDAESDDGSLQFTYTGATGPNMWGKINPNFSTCGNGKWQSPINIWTAKSVLNKKLKPLIRSYPSCNATLVNNKFNVGVRLLTSFRRVGRFALVTFTLCDISLYRHK